MKFHFKAYQSVSEGLRVWIIGIGFHIATDHSEAPVQRYWIKEPKVSLDRASVGFVRDILPDFITGLTNSSASHLAFSQS